MTTCSPAHRRANPAASAAARHGGHDRGPGAGTDPEGVQADADHCVTRTPSAIAVATVSVASTSMAS